MTAFLVFQAAFGDEWILYIYVCFQAACVMGSLNCVDWIDDVGEQGCEPLAGDGVCAVFVAAV